jgi:predicted Zn-dependent peptidase
LCYSIYSYNTSYKDAGLHVIYTALGRETEKKAIEAILEEIKKITVGVTQYELDCAVEQAKSNLLMGLESTSTRMNRLARSQMCLGCVPDMDEVIAKYDSLTVEDIRRVAENTYDMDKISFSAVGRVGSEESYREIIK